MGAECSATPQSLWSGDVGKWLSMHGTWGASYRVQGSRGSLFCVAVKKFTLSYHIMDV